MATKFQVKRNSVSGIVPTTGDISPGELAINLADKKLFTANSTAVFELGSNLTNLSVTGNTTIVGLIANGSLGSAGQVLHSNGTAVYWDTDDSGGGSGSVNTAAVYVWTNTHTFNANLTTNATLIVAKGLEANNSLGSVGQVLFSNGSGVYWGNASSVVVSEQFTANGTANSFTVTGGYIPSAIEVYVSGVKQVPVTDVDITSGTTVNFITPPINNQIVDVFGFQSQLISPGGGGGSVNTGAQYVWTNTHTFNANLTTNSSLIIANSLYANGTTGSAGQVLHSNGTAVYWDNGLVDVIVTANTQAATKDRRYILSNTGITSVVLPANPDLGDLVYVVVANDLDTNFIDRNNEKIMSSNNNLTIDVINASIGLVYVNQTLGWRLI